MNARRIFACSALLLSMTACSSSSSSPTGLDDGDASTPPANPPTNPADPDQPDAGPVLPVSLQTPEYMGELVFASEQAVDLDAFLAEASLRSVNASYVLSQDGQSVRVNITDDLGTVVAVASVDTTTGQETWLARDISSDTRLLFDANNQPVAAVGIACQLPAYTPEPGALFMDITGIVAPEQCIAGSPEISANGNVIIFGTYDQSTSTQYEVQAANLHAYTLDTASLIDFPDTNLVLDGVTLTPQSGTPYLQSRFISDDGRQFFAGIWWGGTGTNGATVREVGAVLIDTASGEWSTRGLADDARGCVPAERFLCTPPYNYVISNDGSTQFSIVPTDTIRDTGGSPFIVFDTVVEQTGTDAPSPVLVSGAENADSLDVNADGSVLLLFTSTIVDPERQGFGLIQPQTGDYVSLNRALNACPSNDDVGDAVESASCQFDTVPMSITNDPSYFTADGSTLLISSVSRFSSITNEQIVQGFLIDIDNGAAYSLPGNYIAVSGRISGDGTVMVGMSDSPEYDLLIGKR